MSDHNERACSKCGSLLHYEDDCPSPPTRPAEQQEHKKDFRITGSHQQKKHQPMTDLPPTQNTKPRYRFGMLTEDFLKALPNEPMTLGEALCGDSKAAKRCRQLSAAYGSISQPAMMEAMRIKYSVPSS